MKITRWVDDLHEDEIFVFGSNLSGLHGGGAARTAMKWGAIWGNPAGPQGRTYAIPTVNKNINGPMDVTEIQPYVDEFIEYDKLHSELIFLVTEIGCGLAGLTVEQIAPMFGRVTELNNVYLPETFIKYLCSGDV